MRKTLFYCGCTERIGSELFRDGREFFKARSGERSGQGQVLRLVKQCRFSGLSVSAESAMVLELLLRGIGLFRRAAAGAAGFGPALLGDLARAAHAEGAGGDVLGDAGAGADVGSVAD